MKKILIASIVALTVALVGAASANAAFNTNLSVGSTGSDVAALQTWLISKGFSIPSIASGVATPGYFGQQTKAAVIAYQASVKLPTTGFVGPLTRGLLNGGTTGTPVVTGMVLPFTCPAGYTAPVGWVCPGTTSTPVTPVNPNTPIVMDGTDGSLTVSLSSYAGNNTIKKGETKDMVAVKLQATAAPVSVSRFDVRMNQRPWLYFSKVTLKDSSGSVIATKNLSGFSDATEITVGSDYLIRFEGINIVTTPGTDRTIVVEGTVLSTTDKLTSDVSVIVSVPTGSIRTINGKGYTDSLGLGTVASSGTTGRTITLSSSGSTANVLIKVASDSPDNRIVTTSTSGETTGVVLGKFSFKSENQASTINSLRFTLNANGGNRDWATMFKRVYVTNGTQTVQADTIPTDSSLASTTTFSNLTFNLPKDEWTTVTVVADVADQDDFISGAMASTSIVARVTSATTMSGLIGIDTNFTAVTSSSANTAASNDITFLPAGASVTAASVKVSDVGNGNSAVSKKSVEYKFTVNNTGTSDIYLSTNPYLAVATTTTFAATSTTFDSLSGGSSKNGDTTSVYIVSSGTSRIFTLAAVIDMTRDGSDKTGEVKVTRVYFGDDTTNIRESSVNFGLDLLTSGVQTFQ